MSKREIEALVDRQNEHYGIIARTCDNLKKLGQRNITLGTIKTRKESIQKNWLKYQENHDRLLQLEYDNEHEYFKSKQYSLCDECYNIQLSTIVDMEYEAQKANDAANPPPAPQPAPAIQLPQELIDALRQSAAPQFQPHSSSQLPRINLPNFDGNYTKWLHFRDLFTSLVGAKSNVPAVEKLQHLKSNLQGEALALVNNLSITEANYQTAWNKLNAKYENTRLLVNAQLESLDAIYPAKVESATDLKRILLATVEAKDALESLGRPIDQQDWLVYRTVKCLDSQTRRDWETSTGGKSEPVEFEELRSFLENRIKALEAIQPKSTSTSSNTKAFQPSPSNRSQAQFKRAMSGVSSHLSTTSNSINRTIKCSLCSQGHFIARCGQYQSLTPNARKQTIFSKKLCFNCLGSHLLPECKSTYACGACNQRHHTSIHDVAKDGPTNRVQSSDASRPSPASQAVSEVTESVRCHQVTLPQPLSQSSCVAPKPALLATALIKVVAPNGVVSQARALVDSCSTDNIVAESLSQRLRLPRRSARFPVRGTGRSSSCTTRGQVSLEVRPHFKSSFEMHVDAYVVTDLTNYMPRCHRDQLNWPHLQGLMLADPDVSATQPFELILGVKAYGRILEEGVRKGPDTAPIAQCTSLGWLLLGELSSSKDAVSQSNTLVSHQCLIDTQLPALLEKFWQQEEIRDKSLPLNDEDKYVEDHYIQTHFRSSDGRYTVRLPVKQPEYQLGDSLTPATRMFQHLERRFLRNEELCKHYSQFMDEYLELGHIEKVDTSGESTPPPRSFYLPHHGVLKATSTTTKLRVVFNGSLNEQLYVGPKLLPELPEILIKWRSHKIVFSADMEKMYRQIWVHEEDRNLQRLLWYDSNDSTIATYRLTTVPFGLALSPYLAIRTLHQLADDEGTTFPVAARILKEDAYVDDVLSGADDLPTALQMQEQLINLLKAGGFSLRKWTSNDPQLLNHLPVDMIAQSNLNWQSSPAYQMLGLNWQPAADHFVFIVQPGELPEKPTKRSVLSLIAQLFDPLGWLAPAIVSAKIFMQSLWQLNLGWDDTLPDHQAAKWKRFHSQLHLLSTVKIPRYLGLSPNNQLCEIHGFADASEQAYSAVLYLRISAEHQSSTVTLVAAKTKVAPLKTTTLPKLELCAALLLAKLSVQVSTSLSLQHTPLHLHSDSTISLHWVKGQPARWKTFVGNRVAQIQRLAPNAHWHHVATEKNPADIATRETEIQEFLLRHNWWTCSAMNLTDAIPWPVVTTVPGLAEVPEEKTIISHQIAIPVEPELWNLSQKYSKLMTLITTTAWCLRYLTKLAKRRNIKLNLPGFDSPTSSSWSLSIEELQNAKIFCVRQVQQQHFQSEIDLLQADSRANIKGALERLTPILDEQRTLRVGGRLKHSLLDEDERHPIILPQKSPFTTLVIRHFHQTALHGGT